MRYLFTVCGRAGSKGMKNKNLKDFLNVPLVYYTLAAIIEFKKILLENDVVDVVLNTDSDKLAEIVCAQKQLNVFVIHRTEDLGGDTVPKVAVIKDCLNQSEQYFKCTYDVVVDLDITSPLRTVNDIKNAVAVKLQRTDTDVVYSVTPSRRSPYFNMVKAENNISEVVIQSSFTARQQAPTIFDMNASIYAYSPYALKNKNSVGFFNSKCYFTVMKDTAVLDIDSEEDFELMQVIAKYIFSLYPDFEKINVSANELKG